MAHSLLSGLWPQHITCKQLISEQEIFRQLARHGRQNVHQVAQRCRLPLRQVRAGIAALIQLRLAFHHTSTDGLSTYQANPSEAYNIMRTSKLINKVNRIWGSDASLLIEILASLGFATVHELRKHAMNESEMTVVDFGFAITKLLTGPFVRIMRNAHFQSPHDARRDVELSVAHTELPTSASAKKVKYDMDEKIDTEYGVRTDSTVEPLEILNQLQAPPSQVRYSPSVTFSLIDIRRIIHFSRLITIK
jgi:hypothetical protein